MTPLGKLAATLLLGLAEAERRRQRDTKTSGREGAIYALTEVCKFVQGAAELADKPSDKLELINRKIILDDLAVALTELEDGVVGAVVRPGPRFNKTQLPRAVREARGRAAAVAQILHLAGEPVERAARLVAERIAEQPELHGIKREAWKAVQKWRSECLSVSERPTWNDFSSNPRSDVMIAVFDEWMRQIETLATEGKDSPQNRRDFAFLVLNLR